MAQSLGGAWGPPESTVKEAVRPLSLETALSAAPLHVLRSAEEDARGELDALAAWNAARRLPTQNGFARSLPQPLAVRLTPSLGGHGAAIPFAGGLLTDAEPGSLTWGTHVRIAGAYRVRLHLTDVHLPAGTRLAVSTPGGEPEWFGLDLLSPRGDLWTPSTRGEAVELEIQVPAAALRGSPAGFDLREAMEIVSLDPRTSMLKDDTSCIVDATCKDNSDLQNIDSYRHAVAQLLFSEGRSSFLCTGSLLNDQAHDSTPYLLTANHCISDQTTASTLQAFFDYDTATCDGTAPFERRGPHANGATLLAHGSAGSGSSDFSFLQLSSLPGGRYFLGWSSDARALQNGTPLFRLSHPAPEGFPRALSYTQYTNDPTFEPCDGITAPQFVYTHVVNGATAGGSSGSALLLGNGQVVGQLGGACGPAPDEICNPDNDDFDGAFAVTYPKVQQWLGSASAPGTTTVTGA
ncbi:MAG TPA: trypsin-like peptidase domain-containing protein, partial [Thermoanaerobaculia bacterium]